MDVARVVCTVCDAVTSLNRWRYSMPPIVKCKTKLWHPNINEEGAVCLSLLRQSSIDELGWAPTRRLKDVVWGLNSLFTDLLNFEDPLNIDAAEMYQKDPTAFQAKVNEYIRRFGEKGMR